MLFWSKICENTYKQSNLFDCFFLSVIYTYDYLHILTTDTLMNFFTTIYNAEYLLITVNNVGSSVAWFRLAK
jgi:hypothetical protein